MRKFAIAAIALAAIAVAVKLIFPGPTTFAFDKTLPKDSTTWEFTVVLDKDATALSRLEDYLLKKNSMSPIFRCESRLFGASWVDKNIPREFTKSMLMRIYTLNLEDTSPPDSNMFIIRHAVFGLKFPMSWRHDKFMCASGINEDGVCTEWDSDGYVHPSITSYLTNGETSNPIYKQKLVMNKDSNKTPKTCPLVKSAWWCLWIFCPVNK